MTAVWSHAAGPGWIRNSNGNLGTAHARFAKDNPRAEDFQGAEARHGRGDRHPWPWKTRASSPRRSGCSMEARSRQRARPPAALARRSAARRPVVVARPWPTAMDRHRPTCERPAASRATARSSCTDAGTNGNTARFVAVGEHRGTAIKASGGRPRRRHHRRRQLPRRVSPNSINDHAAGRSARRADFQAPNAQHDAAHLAGGAAARRRRCGKARMAVLAHSAARRSKAATWNSALAKSYRGPGDRRASHNARPVQRDAGGPAPPDGDRRDPRA